MRRILSLAIAAVFAMSMVSCDDYEYPKSLDGTWVYDHVDGTRDSLFVNNGMATLHVVDKIVVYDVTGPIDYFSSDGIGIMTIPDLTQPLRVVEVQADCKSQCLLSGYGYDDFGYRRKIISRIMQRL